MNNAEVLVKFKGDTKDLESKTNTAKTALSGFGKGIGTAMGIAATAITTTAVAIGDLTKKSVEAYAEYEQLEGGLESMFGKGSDEMNKIMATSETAWQDLTMSQNKYLTSFENAYPLIKAGLSDSADSIEYTNKVLQLSADLFNTYGRSTEYYQNAIEWAMKGSFIYLDNLNIGIKGTEEGFVEAANKCGILGRQIKDVKELTNDEIIDVIQHYAQETGAWGRTQKEASETIIGSLNMVKATWQNFVSGLSKDGADIDGLIDNLISSATTFLNQITPVILRAVEGIASALPQIATKIGELLPGLLESILPKLIDACLNLIESLGNALPSIIMTLSKAIIQAVKGLVKILPQLIDAIIKSAVEIINAVAQALPELLPSLINAILDGLMVILENIDIIIDAGVQLLLGLVQGIIGAIPILIGKLPLIIQALINGILGALPDLIMMTPQIIMAIITGLIQGTAQLVEMAPQIIMSLIEGLMTGLTKMVEIGGQIISRMWDGLKEKWATLKEKIGEIPKDIIDKIKEKLKAIVDVGKNLISGLWSGITNKAQWVIDKIKGLGSSILKAVKGIFGIKSPSRAFAEIGEFNILGLEKGMEDMKPQLQNTLDGIFELQPNVSGTMNSSLSPNINVIVNNNLETDPLGQVVNQIKTFSGGAKNDYNWGATQ